MREHDVERLRSELRNLGYLSGGIDRWFALDPWSSRTFWSELFWLAAKGAAILAPFAALPMLLVLILRNRPLGAGEASILAVVEIAGSFALLFAFMALTGLLLKLRPEWTIDSPRALTGLSLASSILCTSLVGIWWMSFEGESGAIERIPVIAALILFLAVATTLFSAVFLSFSIHETGKIPTMRRRSRAVPVALAGIALVASLTVPEFVEARRSDDASRPLQLVVRPADRRVALVGVDGLSREMFDASLSGLGLAAGTISRIPDVSAAELWATIGSGMPSAIHGVHAIEGLRLAGSGTILQATPAADPILAAAEAVGLLRATPLAPSARKHDYVWEVVAGRGVPAAAVNWWASDEVDSAVLRSVGQEALFRAAGSAGDTPADLALEVDAEVASRVTRVVEERQPMLVAVYFPALDILLHRLELPPARRLALSLRSVEIVRDAVATLRARGYAIVLVGTSPDGGGVVASDLPLELDEFALGDVAPTVADTLGFPASREMTGSSRLRGSTQERVSTFGRRQPRQTAPVDDDYHQKLRSLGYL